MTSRVTEFGKALRHLRVDLDVPMAEMAKAIKCSISYLSAVELGKKKISDPINFVETLAKFFTLTEEQKDQLYDAAASSSDSVPLPITEENGQLMLGFARRIRDTEDFELLKGLLDDFEKKKMAT